MFTPCYVPIVVSRRKSAIHFRQKLCFHFLDESSVNTENSLEVSLLFEFNKSGPGIIRNRGEYA